MKHKDKGHTAHTMSDENGAFDFRSMCDSRRNTHSAL